MGSLNLPVSGLIYLDTSPIIYNLLELVREAQPASHMKL